MVRSIAIAITDTISEIVWKENCPGQPEIDLIDLCDGRNRLRLLQSYLSCPSDLVNL